jgi:hypothetical protein
LAIGLSYITFIMLKYVPSLPSFLEAFYHEGKLNYVKGFICIYWDHHVIFVLYSIYVLYCVYWFAYGKPSLTLELNKLDYGI